MLKKRLEGPEIENGYEVMPKMGANDHEAYVSRRLDPVLDELFEVVPAFLLLDPHAAGKTTASAGLK